MNTEESYHLRKMKIELTDRCGLNCYHCSSNAATDARTTIDVDSCLRILDDAASIGLKSVAFSGGEPLLYNDLLTVVRRASDYKMLVSVYTTGNIDDFQQIAQALKDGGVRRLIFSVYSSNEYRHEAITQKPGSFHATCSAIAVAAKLGFTVELHFVPLVVNYQELEAVIELGLALGASKLSILRFVPHGRGAKVRDQVLSPQQNLELRSSILRLRSRKIMAIRTGSPYNFFLLKDQPRCLAAKDRMTILPDLRIVPCDAFKRISAEIFAGDNAYSSLATARLAECWIKSSYLNAVRSYLRTPFAQECVLCESLEMCHSGCLAQKFLSNGDRRKCRDPDCLRGMIA